MTPDSAEIAENIYEWITRAAAYSQHRQTAVVLIKATHLLTYLLVRQYYNWSCSYV